ncbi:hypothetical protein LEP1GSC052_1521 [Leptospira kmetyi serovar Malaysia str. Bejo-Iso9]|nr:hypothetical protein LEP1GSC052_1521 [Leptospira kmetyi serovar Malaysia str. Bejo-Iso9]
MNKFEAERILYPKKNSEPQNARFFFRSARIVINLFPKNDSILSV